MDKLKDIKEKIISRYNSPERIAERAREKEIMRPEDISKKEFSEKFFNMQCGPLHLEWHLDAYWSLVTKEIILPGALAIHNALVEKKITQENKLRFNDADDTIFFIPQKNTKSKYEGVLTKKIFVHTTQSLDFLYVISETDYSTKFHVRRIYRQWSEDHYYNSEKVIKNISTVLSHVDLLSEYCDDHSEYPHRPSLQFYRDIKFNIGSDKDIYVGKSLRRTYGDFRDPGYILSYELHKSKFYDPNGKIKGSKYVIRDLEMLSTLYIFCLAREFDIEIKTLSGYP